VPTIVSVAYLAAKISMETSVWGHAQTEVQQAAPNAAATAARIFAL
jgi:hypothetical protein